MISAEHYFDWAATTPADEQIQKEALSFALEHWGNPSSIHEAGADAKRALEECRKQCALALNVQTDTIFFTSGGTESDHIPLLSVLTRPQKGSVLLSAIEHPALREMAKAITNCGWKVITVNPDKNGIVSAQSIQDALTDDTVYVSVMAVNNETGAVQPIYEISDMLTQRAQGRRRPFFHVDCVQAAGKIPLDISYKGIDAASFSAHKLGGPRGIGALYLAKDITPFLRGGGQEKNIRSGTENIFGAKALSLCLSKYTISKNNEETLKRYENQMEWTASFIKQILELPGAVILPHVRGTAPESRDFSPWIVQAAFPGIPGQVMERALSADGFYISTGSACSAGRHSRPILDSMNVSADEKESAVRFSFGAGTTKQAMEELVQEVRKIVSTFAS